MNQYINDKPYFTFLVFLTFFLSVFFTSCEPKEFQPSHQFVDGFFEVYDENGKINTLIFRQGNVQTEYYFEDGEKDKASVRWISETEYEINNAYNIESESDHLKPGAIFPFKIDSFASDHYYYSMRISKEAKPIKGKVVKLGDVIPVRYQHFF